MKLESKYMIIEELHAGSNSFVSRARRVHDGHTVILKRPRNPAPTAGDRVCLRREADVLDELQAAHVMRVPRALELFVAESDLALVLSDEPGVPIQELTRTSSLELTEQLEVAAATARVLADIHDAGWVHGDLSANNVLRDPERGLVTIIDFGSASHVERDTGTHATAARRATPAYLAPEQTGRLQRSVDGRTDLYALGVILYQLFTGTLPFDTTDPQALIHAHLALTPRSLQSVVPSLPSVLNAIVQKLLRKEPRERYQSARTLVRDLERCIEQLRDHGLIQEFALAENDAWSRLEPPQDLIGRATELAELQAAFAAVKQGGVEHLLLGGAPGIGKTSLARALHESVTAANGYFIAGKYDQLQRDVPFSALAAAFDDLVRQILSEPEQRVASWKERLGQALGTGAEDVTKAIPSLGTLLGEPPDAPDAHGAEALNRFNLALVNLVQTVSQPDHPLVLFLDDVQWIDPASLKALSMILSSPGSAAFLLISAYRDNEVTATHPFMMTVADQERAGAGTRKLTLCELNLEQTQQLVRATLRADADQTDELGEIVWSKTAGNPFFARQLLAALENEGVIAFDAPAGRFAVKLDAARKLDVSENVVDLMVHKLRELPEPTQTALQQASVIGNQFQLCDLQDLNQAPPAKLYEWLLPAVRVGLIVPASELSDLDGHGTSLGYSAFRFVHDRVQQAAYTTIEPDQRPQLHLAIGRVLLSQTTESDVPARVFDLVSHLNQAIDLQTSPEERRQLIRLNLLAAERAQEATAYSFAISAFRTAISLIGEAGWRDDPQQTHRAHLRFAESLALDARGDEAFEVIDEALRRCEATMPRAELLIGKLNVHVALGQMPEAADCAVDTAALLGLELPRDPELTRELLQGEIGAILAKISDTSIESFLELPEMRDPEKLLLMRVLMYSIPPLYQVNQELFALVCCKMVTLSFEHGNCPVSAKGYGSFAVIASGVLGRYEDAQRFGKLGVDLTLRFGDRSVRAASYFVWAAFASAWNRPIAESIELFREGVKVGLQAGDHMHTAYCASRCLTHELFMGLHLDELEQHAREYLELVHRLHDPTNERVLAACLQLIRWLKGEFGGAQTLSGDGFDEAQFLQMLNDVGNQTIVSYFVTLRVVHRYWSGAYREALEFSEESQALLPYSVGFISVAEHSIYRSLTVTALWSEATSEERERFRELLDGDQKLLAEWSQSSPDNFGVFAELVAAERARVEERPLEAMVGYDRALAEASRVGMGHAEGLVAELAARFWRGQGRHVCADAYLSRACDAYRTWGAVARAEELSGGDHSGSGTATHTVHLASERAGALDVASVLKAGTAVASELDLPSLLRKLLLLTLENGGAEAGAFVLCEDASLLVQASQVRGEVPLVLQAEEIDKSQAIASTIVRYVARTKEPVSLDNAAERGQFRHDASVRRRQAKSILCLPIIHQNQLVGVAYLENNLIEGAFTSQRIEALEVLTALAAAAIQNARLFTQQQRHREQIEGKNQELRVEAEHREKAQRELQTYRDHLEELVAARTAELKQAQGRLMEMSRQAGMAEVASGVLHNVGNVLNSVNVGTSVARDGIRSMHVGSVAKVAQLLAEHADDLGHYLSNDERGRKVPEYLRSLSSTLEQEQNSIVQSIDATVEHLDHMKQIIAAQQTFGQAVTIDEVCDLESVIDTALEMSMPSGPRIEVIRDYQPLAPVLIDRHQVLQILVNLLSNARHAVLEPNVENPQVRIRLAPTDDASFQIAVEDNGVGIDSAILARVFTYGFTTKKEGHGFGLHNSANTAQRLGGELTASSEGKGRGARLTLKLPFRSQTGVGTETAVTGRSLAPISSPGAE